MVQQGRGRIRTGGVRVLQTLALDHSATRPTYLVCSIYGALNITAR